MKEEYWKETRRDSPLASIGNAGNINSSCFIFLQLEGICMEVVYKCEVLFYCFQKQQTEVKIRKEQNCFSRISVDFNLLYARKVDFLIGGNSV